MRPQLKQRRSVTTPSDAHVEGIAQYLLIIGPDSKIHEMDSVAALRDTVRAGTFPLIFPDATLKKLPALSVLSCPRSDEPSTFTLLSAQAGPVILPGLHTRIIRSSS
jgi:hypothetical protein